MFRFPNSCALAITLVAFCLFASSPREAFASQRELPIFRQNFQQIFNEIARKNNSGVSVTGASFRSPWCHYTIAEGIEIGGFVHPSGSIRDLNVTLRLTKTHDYRKFLNTVSCLIDVVDPSLGAEKTDLLNRLGISRRPNSELPRTETEKNGFQYNARSYDEGLRIYFSISQSFDAYRANSGGRRRNPGIARLSETPQSNKNEQRQRSNDDPFASTEPMVDDATSSKNTKQFSEMASPQVSHEEPFANSKTPSKNNNIRPPWNSSANAATRSSNNTDDPTFPPVAQVRRTQDSIANSQYSSENRAPGDLKTETTQNSKPPADSMQSSRAINNTGADGDIASSTDYQVLDENTAQPLYPHTKPSGKVLLKPSNIPITLDKIIQASLIWNGESLFNDPGRGNQIDAAIPPFVKKPFSPVAKDAGELYRISLNKLARGQRSSGAERELLLQEAATGLQLVHQAYPKWVYPLCWLADCEVAQGKFSQARAHFIETLILDPRWQMPWHELGFILAKEGDKERALGCLLIAYGLSSDTADTMFNIQNMRYGKDKNCAEVGAEAMKRICATELTYLVKCAVSFTESSYRPSDGVIEIVGLRPGLNSPIREGARFQRDRKGLFKSDLSSWTKNTMEKTTKPRALSTRKPQIVSARIHIDRLGKTSDVALLQPTNEQYTDQQLIESLRRNSYDKLPPGASDVILELTFYLGLPVPPELK